MTGLAQILQKVTQNSSRKRVHVVAAVVGQCINGRCILSTKQNVTAVMYIFTIKKNLCSS